MGPSSKSKRRPLPANYVYKTADDFIRWRRAQDTIKKQGTKEQIIQSDRVSTKALMVWEDDGGAVEIS